MADNQRGFNVGVFKAEMANKRLLRPNLFHVEFSIPPGLQTNETQFFNSTARTLEYWCEATSVPGFGLNTYQGQRYGYGTIEQRPVIPVYGEQNFTFIMDSETVNYDFFREWMNIIINTDMSEGTVGQTGQVVSGGRLSVMDPFELSYREDYLADASILIYDQKGNVVKKITLRDAFPKAIGDIALAWGDNNTYMRLPVTFAYTDWFTTPIGN